MSSRLARVIKRIGNDEWLFIGLIALLALNGLYYFSNSDSRVVLGYSCVVALSVVSVYLLYSIGQKKRLKIEHLYLVIMICCGLYYVVVFAPFVVPDEQYHFQASYKLADAIMLRDSSALLLPMREDDIRFMNDLCASVHLDASQYAATLSNLSFFAGNSNIASVVPVSVFDFAQNPPQVKIASALGIVVAQLFNLGSVPLFYMGRLFNLAFFIALIYCSVKIAPVGKNIIMAVGLMPMSLHLGASYSYDAGIIGLACLFSAFCLKAIYGNDSIDRGVLWGVFASAVILAPCKVVYVLLVLSIILIPRHRFSSERRALAYKLGVIAAAFAAIILIRILAALSLYGVDLSNAPHSGVRSGEGPLYDLAGLLTDPVGSVLLYLRTFDASGGFLLESFVGGCLGWFQDDIRAPFYITLTFLYVLLFTCFKNPSDEIDIPMKHRLLYLVIGLTALLSIMLSMALSHTFASEPAIQGVQGRYLLPLVPLAFLALRFKKIYIGYDCSRLIPFCLLVMNAAYTTRVLALAVNLP